MELSRTEDKANSKLIASKLTSEGWSDVEKRFSTFDLSVLESLNRYTKDLIKGTNDTGLVRQVIIKALGDLFYNKIRPQLYAVGLVIRQDPIHTDDKKMKKKAKNIKKKTLNADEIREKNAFEKLDTIFKDRINSLKMDRFAPHQALRSDIVEIIGVGFMYMLKYVIHHSKKYSVGSNYIEVLSMMVSVQRFINQCKEYEGYDMIRPNETRKISKQLIVDMEDMYKIAEDTFPYDGLTVYEKAPQLLIWSEYDQYIPNMGITPRNHQKELIERLVGSMDRGMLCIYRAMIGSGKTTAIRGIATLVDHLKKANNVYKHLQALFCCNLQSVKIQVGQICYNQNIPFAMASIDKQGKYRIINNYNCKKDSDRLVIICSPDVADMILNDTTNDLEMGRAYDRFILFHDEPTIGADSKGSISLENNVKTMLSLPKWSILSSATFPMIEELPQIIEKVREDNKLVNIVDITSSEVQIGCDVMTFDGRIVVPYMGCENGTDLQRVIDLIRRTPFLGKQLTSNVALTLWKKCVDMKIGGIPNIPETFKNVMNMKADRIRETVLDILTILTKESDECVKSICESAIAENDENAIHRIDMNLIGTTEAWKMQNMTLIATNNPEQKVLEWFGGLLDRLSAGGIRAHRILSNYKKKLDAHNEQIERMLAKLKSSERRSGGEEKVRSATDDEKMRKRSELESEQPRIEFPEWAQIGTLEHHHIFSKDHKMTTYRTPLILESMQLDTLMIPDEYILLLMCGVGCYYPESKVLDHSYLETVLKLASEGKLAYMVADNSISYGTNYPINQVIVMDDFSSTHSLNTLFQLMGRAGRVGRSWKAKSYISQSMADILVDYGVHPERYNIEVENIKNMVGLIHSRYEQNIENEMNCLREEAIKQMNRNEKKEIIVEKLTEEWEDFEDIVDIVEKKMVPLSSIELGGGNRTKGNMRDGNWRNGNWRNGNQ